MPSRRARYINVALGLWLFSSAFLWPHPRHQFTNTWFMGALTIAIACLAMKVPRLRYINGLIGAWLVASAVLSPNTSAVTTWNNVLVGCAIFSVALITNVPPRLSALQR
jgi:hypothetical protein